MPTIRPISDLRNHAKDISDLCHQLKEPVFITKDGQGDLVVMSQEVFDRQQARLELYARLGEAERHPGGRPAAHKSVIRALKKRLA